MKIAWEIVKLLVVIVFAVAVVSLYGCATISEEEQFRREYNESLDRERWQLCQRIYRQHGKYTVSRHSHDRRRTSGRHGPSEVKDDLIVNQCRMVIGREAWGDNL